MKNISIYNVILFLGLLFSSAVQAAPEAEYRTLSKAYTLNPDGSQEYRYSMELTLFTHTAMNRTYGESFVVYNPQYQEVKIHHSYTRQVDGTIIETPENAFVEVLPRRAANAPGHNHLKELVIVHTGLELGATIYLDYSVLTKPGYLTELDIFEEIEQTSPVKEYTISISVPQSKSLHSHLAQVKAVPQTDTTEGKKTVKWVFRDLPAASQAPRVWTANGDVPFLAASTWRTEEEALASLFAQFNPSQDRLQFLTFAEALTEHVKDEEGKISAVLEYVYDKLDLSPLSLQETGYRLRPLDEVTASAYATAAEKANMLYTLLSALEYAPTLWAAYQAEAPDGALGLSAVKELFVVVNGFPLSVTGKGVSPVCIYGDLYPARNVSIKGIKGKMNYPAFGYQEPATFQLRISGKEVQSAARTVKKLTEVQFPEPFPDKIWSETAETLKMQELPSGYLLLTLPEGKADIRKQGFQSYNSTREKTLSLLYGAGEYNVYTVEIPDGMELLIQTNPFPSVKNKAGSYEYSLQQEGATATVTRKLTLDTTTITPDLYPDFRELMVAWDDQVARSLLLRKK
ncbi:MAG: DUF3857 domain-containing protein [Tannerellaceae bacterium]|nr:DUF3857 domain-containing protein [Tannerellaceae bacterium]